MSNTGALALDRFPGGRRLTAAGPTSRLAAGSAGHFWTIAPALRAAVTPPAQMPARPFQVTVQDNAIGEVRLSGLLCDAPASETIVVIIHGIGGDAYSPCCLAAARAV